MKIIARYKTTLHILLVLLVCPQISRADVFNDIFEDFQDTWTLLQAIENKLCTLITSVDTATATIQNGFANTWTQLECFTDIPISGPTTITVPGTYCVTQDITAASGDVITVASSDVHINMQGHTLSATSGDGIVINSNLNNIAIQDGFVKDCSGDGINVGHGATIILNNIIIDDCDNGLVATGTALTITNCAFVNNTNDGARLTNLCESVILHCDFCGNSSGVTLNSSFNNLLQECNALQNSIAGVALDLSDNNCIKLCNALENGGSGNAYGFVSNNGQSNSFNECVADCTQTSGTDAALCAAGFLLTTTENNSTIINCISNNTSAAGSASAFGIKLIDANKCLILENKINSVTGGSASTGIDETRTSSSFENLILSNLAYCNDTNYDVIEAPVYTDGVKGYPTRLDNLSFPPLTSSGIPDPFQATLTALDELETTVCNKFESLWNSLNGIGGSGQETVDNLINQTFTIIADISDTQCRKFEETWTALANVKTTFNRNIECPIFITQEDMNDTYTISTAGVYKLQENILYSGGSPAILIDTDCVTLDLHNKKITLEATSERKMGITVSSGSADVTIKNGTLEGFTNFSIDVEESCTRITTKKIDSINAEGGNISYLGSDGNEVTNSFIIDCRVINAMSNPTTGRSIRADFCDRCRIEGCHVFNCDSSGNFLDGVTCTDSESTSVLHCKVYNNSSQQDTKGFQLFSNGLDTIVQHCQVKNNTGIQDVTGYNLEHNNMMIENCIAQGNTNTGTSGTSSNFTCVGFNNTGNVTDFIIRKCSVLGHIASRGQAAGFRFQGANFISLIDCLVINLEKTDNTQYLQGFRSHSNNADDHSFVRCTAQGLFGPGTLSSVRGFNTASSANRVEHVGCQALFNGRNGATLARGFFAAGSASNYIDVNNFAIRNGAAAGDQFVGLGAWADATGTSAAAPTWTTGGAATTAVSRFAWQNIGAF